MAAGFVPDQPRDIEKEVFLLVDSHLIQQTSFCLKGDQIISKICTNGSLSALDHFIFGRGTVLHICSSTVLSSIFETCSFTQADDLL